MRILSEKYRRKRERAAIGTRIGITPQKLKLIIKRAIR